jgi:3-oxoacyl-[acyl-carrier-protein] synthase-3
MKQAVINGTGSYLPERIVTNYELETQLDTSHEWIFSRTGIRSRHVANAQETTAFMAGKAALKALECSTITANDIDLILVATCTPSHFFPSMASHVQQALNITRAIPSFDISAACSGFIYVMDIANQYIKAHTAKHVLVIGSECMSRAIDWTNRATCVLFGDGAGAIILSAEEAPGIIGSVLHSSFDKDGLLTYPNSALDSLCQKPALIGMRGNEVFKQAVTMMGNIVDEVLLACNLEKSAIDWLIPHQANIRIIKGIAKKLTLPMSQVHTACARLFIARKSN